MATVSAEPADGSLSQQLDRSLKLYSEVKDSTAPSGDETLQVSVQEAICALEQLTRAVSEAGLFSRNESLEELPTSSLRFLLLPQLLGDLTCRRSHADRMEVITIAEVYYRDFLQRCRDYGVTGAELPRPREDQTAEAASRQPRPPTMRDLATMSKQREERLRRYREQKELDKQLATLQAAMARPSPDDEVVRAYHLTLLRQAVGKAVAELSSLQLEKPILEHMQQLKARGGAAAEPAPPRPPVAPLRPVVITRTRLEAAVFGTGYSALPTMSVEELYEQRVSDGTWKAGGAAPVNQPAQSSDDVTRETQERLEERDDPAALARARQWDDYKDDHKRGEGNRYNRS